MNSRQVIIDAQLTWARAHGFAPDRRGYVARVEDNLFRPLSGGAKAAFDQGSGGELVDTPRSPAKMKALHSSSALAVNVFDYWFDQDAKPLVAALNLGVGITRLAFEAQYPTGLAGNPPNLDVVLELVGGRQFAIESKFTEWMQPKARGKAPFKEKYFDSKLGLWAQFDLGGCQQLAVGMQSGDIEFRYLDAAQLLKHALGLSTQLGRAVSLAYIYFDAPGAAGDAHTEEIERFAAEIDDSLSFTAIRYQELYSRLRQSADDRHADYLAYLGQRYFSAAIGV